MITFQRQRKPLQLEQFIDLDQNDYLALSKNAISLQEKLFHSKGRINSSTISKNKRFLAISGTQYKLVILSNQRSKIIKSIRFRYMVEQSVFSLDGNYIYVAFPFHIIIISMVEGFKQIKSCSINIFQDSHFKELTLNAIIFCFENQIIIQDFFNNKRIYILLLDSKIYSFYYIEQEHALVCSSESQILSLYINNNQIIKQVMKYDSLIEIQKLQIKQLKFLNNQNIIGSQYMSLIIWFVDQCMKEFQNVYTFKQCSSCFDINLDLSSRSIILYWNKIMYGYSLQKGNQEQYKDKKRNFLQRNRIILAQFDKNKK